MLQYGSDIADVIVCLAAAKQGSWWTVSWTISWTVAVPTYHTEKKQREKEAVHL